MWSIRCTAKTPAEHSKSLQITRSKHGQVHLIMKLHHFRVYVNKWRNHDLTNQHICATSGFPHQGSEWGDDANTPSASNGMVKAIYVVRGSVEIIIPGRYRTVNHGTVLTSQLDHTWSPLLTLRAREDKDPSRLQYQCYGHTQVDTRMITQVSTCEGEHWHVPK